MKCHQCNNEAMFLVSIEGNQVPLCLNCNEKFQQMLAQQRDGLERQMNFVMDSVEMISGIPTKRPRFPERDFIQIQSPTFHNINIDRSTIGVINTGNVQTVDSAVTVLRDSGSEDLSNAIMGFTQAVISNNDLNAKIKNDILEILSLLASEATVPKDKRRSKAMKPLLSQLSNLVGIVSGLSTIWDHVKPIFEFVFQ